MGRRKKSKTSATEREASRRRSRAAWIRNKIKADQPVTDEQREWLTAYEIEPHGNAAESKEFMDATPAADAPNIDSPDLGEPAPPEDLLELPRILPPLPDAPPPPPKVPRPERSERKSAPGGKWQDKYSYLGEDTHDGREAACVYVSSLWHGVLKQMADAIKEIGEDPVVDPDILSGAMVLTLDRALPPEFALTPEIVAVGGSSALLVQRFLRREKIARARELKELQGRGSRPVHLTAVPPPPPQEEPTVDEPKPATEGKEGKAGQGPTLAAVPRPHEPPSRGYDPSGLL